MPTYEYECKDCLYRFEEFQKITDKPLTTCPKCGGQLRRLITGGVGLIFKGSGFYVTDYKRSTLPAKSEGKSKQLQKKVEPPKPSDEKETNSKKE